MLIDVELVVYTLNINGSSVKRLIGSYDIE